ncbi:unnamed protein product, partial [Brachionus calyciflorus]
MGNTTCVASNGTQIPPDNHYKCRHSKNDKLHESRYYDHKDIHRFQVPSNKINFNTPFPEYKPTEFTAEKILAKTTSLDKDPDIDDPEYKTIKFNAIDSKYGCDRQSYHGNYEFIRFKPHMNELVPMNPVGRTGMIGRGRLFRWGPNHAADPIVTRWKRDSEGQIKTDPITDKGILEFVAIQRKHTEEWAIPGGMRDPGEKIAKTLSREFKEEALNLNNNKDLEFNKFQRIVSHTTNYVKLIDDFFKGGIEIYKGYMDDPRNTDNAWMETL